MQSSNRKLLFNKNYGKFYSNINKMSSHKYQIRNLLNLTAYLNHFMTV